MVERDSKPLDRVFHALADPTRRAMLRLLVDGERSVGELAAPQAMSLAAASKHIQVLERAGLVQRTVLGRTHLCRLDVQPMHAGIEWMRFYERFWDGRLDALAALLESETTSPPTARTAAKSKGKRR